MLTYIDWPDFVGAVSEHWRGDARKPARGPGNRSMTTSEIGSPTIGSMGDTGNPS